MTDHPLLFAFLALRLSDARIDILNDYELLSTKWPDRGTFMYDGRETPFRIVTEPEQLRGLELCGWAFVRSATGGMSRYNINHCTQLRQMADLMLRKRPKNNCNKPLAMSD